MGWDFETEPEYQEKLDWVDRFLREDVEPLDYVLGDAYDKSDQRALAVVRPLQQKVREQRLWAAHLKPEMGGQGYGQVKLALLNELLGRSRWAPSVFGCQAPDSGNAEILAHFGTAEQKAKYLQPLLDGTISSCYSMTEPHAGADPTLFRTRAVRDGDEWVLNGEKWFSSNARYASLLVVMAVTNPDVSAYEGMSMFLVPADTPGITLHPLRTWQSAAAHQFTVFYDGVRIPRGNVLGEVGGGFALGQQWLAVNDRLTRGAMATGFLSRGLDMAVDWVRTRRTFGRPLAERQAIQWMLVDILLDLKSIRAISYECAARADAGDDVRAHAAMAKLAGANWGHRSMDKLMQIFGGMGEAMDHPIPHWYHIIRHGRIGGGTDEIQRILISRAILEGDPSLWRA